MNDIFIISDTHFQHQKIHEFEPTRPGYGAPIQVHDEILVENWNKVVKETDKIYHLGDVYFGDFGTASKIIKRLNGKKFLIPGNHDRIQLLGISRLFKDISLWKIFDGLLLTHVPVHHSVLTEGRFTHGKGWYNVHGHTHSQGSPEGPYKCVCVEHTYYAPISLEEIRDETKEDCKEEGNTKDTM